MDGKFLTVEVGGHSKVRRKNWNDPDNRWSWRLVWTCVWLNIDTFGYK